MAELPPLTTEDFPAFVQKVHGFAPMRWQRRLLAGHAASADWPDVVKVPTGLGKTLLVDIAVFALAQQAHRDARERTARTRTFVIVDRRLVVDDIHAHAEKIADALEAADPASVTGRVAARLRHIAARPTSAPEPDAVPPAHRPLEVTRMRGGVTWAARWVMRPEQPTVVVGTVDQLGSRMLFRGYGVSQGSLPIDAALTGTDALVILDEAHLADALRETVSELHDVEAAAPEAVLPHRPPRLIAMSATPLPTDNAFELDDTDRAEDIARQRLTARKPVSLWDITDAPKRDAAAARRRLASVLAEAARRLLAEGPQIEVLGVVANTVQTARAAFDLIRDSGIDADLLIGRSREVDRDLLSRRIRARAGIERRAGSEAAEPYVVVATQTIEVGVNLDLDALVTEAASLDALAQRLGRLDRQGHRTQNGLTSPVTIVHVEGLHDGDPVYGAALQATWAWLTSLDDPQSIRGATAQRKASLEGRVDLGPAALDGLVDERERASLVSAPPRRPTLFPREHLAGWAQTAPQPRTGVDITPFMRGVADPQPVVQVCWRADMRVGDPIGSAARSLDIRPVLPGEVVEVPVWHARSWLARLAADEVPLTDGPLPGMVEGAPGADAVRLPVVGVEERGEPRLLQAADELKPGDTLLCPSAVGGLDAYGWSPQQHRDVLDVADLCRTRAGVAVRADRNPLAQFGSGPGDRAAAWLRTVEERLTESPTARLPQAVAGATAAWLVDEGLEPHPASGAAAVAQALLVCLCAEPRAESYEHHRIELIRMLDEVTSGRWVKWLEVTVDDEGHDLRVVLRAKERTDRTRGGEQQRDSDESTAVGGRAVPLRDHSSAVAMSAMASAERLGLPGSLVSAVGLAAEAHDLGKVDPRFQQMLHGGDAFAQASAEEPLAKSGMDPADRQAFRRARDDAGWPAGMRHEALSLALIDAWLSMADSADLDADLVKHLVATHHGYARPLFEPPEHPKVADLQADFHGRTVTIAAPDVERYLVDWEAPGRMGRLLERHGAWGLALLETIVRLADMRCSEAGT